MVIDESFFIAIMLRVSDRWLQRKFSLKDGNAARQPNQSLGRTFKHRWESIGEVRNIGGVFHRRFAFLEDRLLRWWNTNTAVNEPVRWISFMHLYLDWQLTFGHPGVILLDGRWFDGAIAGATPEAYHHNLRTKWWRLMLQQFFKDAGLGVGRATLPPFSSVVYQFVGAASIPWPSHRIEKVDLWICERLNGARGNGSVFKHLPLAGQVQGMDL